MQLLSPSISPPLSSCCCHLTSAVAVVVIVVVARLQFDEMPHINIEINANYKYLIDDPTPALARVSEGERGEKGETEVYNDARQVFILKAFSL